MMAESLVRYFMVPAFLLVNTLVIIFTCCPYWLVMFYWKELRVWPSAIDNNYRDFWERHFMVYSWGSWTNIFGAYHVSLIRSFYSSAHLVTISDYVPSFDKTKLPDLDGNFRSHSMILLVNLVILATVKSLDTMFCKFIMVKRKWQKEICIHM